MPETHPSDKLYYSIGEVAKLFNVKTSLIRFWENEFDILKPKRNKKGNRFFTKKDMDNIHLIYHYTKERGMTLEGVKRKLRDNKENTINEFEIIRKLKKIREQLIQIRDTIE